MTGMNDIVAQAHWKWGSHKDGAPWTPSTAPHPTRFSRIEMLTDEAMDSQRQLEDSMAQRSASAAEAEALQARLGETEAALAAAQAKLAAQEAVAPVPAQMAPGAPAEAAASPEVDSGKALGAANREIQLLQVGLPMYGRARPFCRAKPVFRR